MTHSYVVVDSFTRTPLAGNPVAIVMAADDLTPTRMQSIANEMHLSETVFVLAPQDGGDARIRIFTPVNELPFAGHPFLGLGVVLGAICRASHLEIETAMGFLSLDIDNYGQSTHVRMTQPIPTWTPYPAAAALLDILSVAEPTAPVEAYRNGPRHVFVGINTTDELSTIIPDHSALAEHKDMSAICFAPDGDHWRCRMFSPAYGVVEDAATGSAAGPLAIHLARHGMDHTNRQIHIVQGVEIGRRSDMTALITGNTDKIDEVHVSGYGVIVARGELLV